MAQYTYQPVNLEGFSIRLLRLMSGEDTDNVKGEIFEGWTDTSESGIPYEALSYTWGSSEKTAKIFVDGNIMPITSNLFSALQHIRLKDQDRILWIDAICINQEDNQEKTHQVRHMSRIYKEAERVLVWLGEGTTETDSVMDFMNQWSHCHIIVNGDWRSLVMSQVSMSPAHFRVRWRKGMMVMWERQWFQRIWVLQEIAHARVAIIHCGKKSVSARNFSQVPTLMGWEPEPRCQAVLDIMPGHSRKESWWSKERSLLNLLIKFGRSEASDERDIIYALLNISSDAYKSDSLFPDYSKSIDEVTENAISFLKLPRNEFPSSHINTFENFISRLIDSRSLDHFKYLLTQGQLGQIKSWIGSEGVDINGKDEKKRTPLFLAANTEHEAAVRLLIEKGAEINSTDVDGKAPLHEAAGNGHTAIVHLLINKGAKLELKDNWGRTPLDWAARYGHLAIMRLLIENGTTKGYLNIGW